MDLGLSAVILALITIISPLFVAVATRYSWSSKTKNAVAAIVALVIALGYLVMTGGITDWTNVVTIIPAVYGLQQLVYTQFLKEASAHVQITVNAGKSEDFDGSVKG